MKLRFVNFFVNFPLNEYWIGLDEGVTLTMTMMLRSLAGIWTTLRVSGRVSWLII